MNTPDLHAAAHELHRAGIRVIPVRADGTKAPALKAWQTHATDEQDIDQWFRIVPSKNRSAFTAMGIVTGTPSGNIELAEIEGDYAHRVPELAELAQASGLGDLWARINRGWTELSPSGGLHWVYKVIGTDVPGNTKLAQDEPRIVDGKRIIPTIAETRGTGGQFVAAPTGGHAHASGKPWVRVSGGPEHITVLTDEERAQFHAILGSLDRRPQHDTTPTTTIQDATEWAGVMAELESLPHGPKPIEGQTPGDDFEEKTSWADLLEPAGWAKVFTRGNTIYWRRPGKDIGFSATTGHADDRDRLYVFSSSTDFPTQEPITKFGAYAIMNHGGDHAKAASKLRKDGYGAPLPDNTRPQPGTSTPAQPAAQDSGEQGEWATGGATTSTMVREPRRWDDIGLRSHQRIAARLAQYADGKLLYVTGSGWHQWTGTHWKQDKRSKKAHQRLAELLKSCWIEAVDDKDLANDVKACMSATGTKGVLELASRLPQLAVDHVDTDPYLLNTPAGTLDLHTLELKEHDPTDRITKITRASYNPDANNTRWTDFLNSSLPDQAVQGFLQRYIGVSLIGKAVEHLLVIMTGSGRNGKGVLANTVEFAMGDYAITANNQMLVSGRYRGESAGEKSSLMRLRGARLAIMSELEKGSRLAEATMKALTGGDQIEAKFMGQDAVQFAPTHSFLMLTNDLPSVDPTAQAVWARLRVVPFDISFEGREDHSLEDDLRLAADTVLGWAVEGLRAYRNTGLAAPDAVLATTDNYRTDNDPLAQFFEDECVLHADAKVTRMSLHHAYLEWAKENAADPMTAHKFSPRIANVPGISSDKVQGHRRWLGIGLKSEDGGISKDPWDRLPDPDQDSDPVAYKDN